MASFTSVNAGAVKVGFAGQESKFSATNTVLAVRTVLERLYGPGWIEDDGVMMDDDALVGTARGVVSFIIFQRPKSTKPCEHGQSNNAAIWKRPTVSASVIANEQPELYDVFAHVCGAETYVPCVRLQNMIDWESSEQEIVSFQAALGTSFYCADTFRKFAEGWETVVAYHNLRVLLTTMVKFSNELLTHSCKQEAMYLANSSTPAHGLYLCSREEQQPAVVIGSAATCAEASVRSCFPELIAFCGSSCIELHRMGIPREDCAVVGIAVAGSSCQFCGMYLLRDNFPVMVALSPVLTLGGTMQEQRSLAAWCLRFVHFGAEMSTLSLSYESLLSSAQVQVRQEDVVVGLSISDYFAKPVRCRLEEGTEYQYADGRPRQFSDKFIRLNHIMRMYEMLRKTATVDHDDVKSLVLFPEGVVSVPDDDVEDSADIRTKLIACCERDGFRHMDLTFTPLILFPRLDSVNDGWATEKPPPHLRDSYIAQLVRVRDVLNRAEIAHLDQHPANIMWRQRQRKPMMAESVAREPANEKQEHEDKPMPEPAESASKRLNCDDTDTCCSCGNNSAVAFEVEVRLIDFEDAVCFNHVIPPRFVQAVVNSADSRYPFKRGDDEALQFAGPKHNEFFLMAVTRWVHSDVGDFKRFMNKEGAAIRASVFD